MTLFLLTFDRKNRSATVEAIPEEEDALRRLFAAERRLPDEPGLEIVLLAASDEDDLRRTHARYFESIDELLEPA